MPATLEKLLTTKGILIRRNHQSIKEALARYQGKFVLVDSNYLHEHNGILISLANGLPHRSFYPGKVLSLGESSFKFELSEESNKPELDVPYKTVLGFLPIKEGEEFVASYYQKNNVPSHLNVWVH